MEASESTELIPVGQADVPAVQMELSVEAVLKHAEKILEIMRQGMKEDVHYGHIPKCPKPCLFQPGAEKLCLMFRLAPEYTVTVEHDRDAEREYSKGICKGFVRYTVQCTLKHSTTGDVVSAGVGVCSNWEKKFISRDAFEVEETIIQMARKRALVNAVRTGTAASDIFTQDEEQIRSAVQPQAPSTDIQKGASTAGMPPASPPVDAPPASPSSPYKIPAPLCPEPGCGSEMWDNRGSNKGGPLFKCKKSKWDAQTRTEIGCPGTIWPKEWAAMQKARQLQNELADSFDASMNEPQPPPPLGAVCGACQGTSFVLNFNGKQECIQCGLELE